MQIEVAIAIYSNYSKYCACKEREAVILILATPDSADSDDDSPYKASQRHMPGTLLAKAQLHQDTSMSPMTIVTDEGRQAKKACHRHMIKTRRYGPVDRRLRVSGKCVLA